jgi:hypothetical protein
MPTEFTFGGGDERISIRIEASKSISNESPTYKNRLESTVNLTIGAFSGAFKAEFAISDLVLLHEQLVSAFTSPSEIVVFKNAEGDLYLAIEFNDKTPPSQASELDFPTRHISIRSRADSGGGREGASGISASI